MLRRCKIVLLKQENKVIEMYFINKKNITEINQALNSQGYLISRESIRRFILEFKQLLKKYNNADDIKKYAFLNCNYILDLNLIEKLI